MKESSGLNLARGDGAAVEVVNPDGAGGVVLVCEHASHVIPAALHDLGLRAEDRMSHAVWDIGARALALHLSEALDAPLVAGGLSRLVYDCNRPPEAPDAIPARSEVIEVPGNRGLDAAARAARADAVYHPFRRTLTQVLDTRQPPFALVTIHSFTPVFNGRPRAVELGLLHDSDADLALAAMRAANARGIELDTRLNAPYDATDGVTHTLREHGVARGIPNLMIEVSNALLRDAAGVARIGALLAPLLSDAIAACLPAQGHNQRGAAR